MVQITYKDKTVMRINIRAVAMVTLILPSLVFLLTHVRWVFAVPCSVFLAVSVFLYIRGSHNRELSPAGGGTDQISLLMAASCLLIAALWTFFSGIGGFFSQSYDFNGRNAIIHDLFSNPWPVYFMDTPYALTYYTGYWLIPAGIAKLFVPLIGSDAAWNVMNVFQFVETVWMLWIAFVLLITLFRKTRYPVLILLFFVFFSGLDAIMYYLRAGWKLDSHLDRWAEFWQYSSNTTCLFWVYNQAVPAWIAILMLLHSPDELRSYALTGLSIAICSPFPLVGFALICIVLFVFRAVRACRKKEKFYGYLKDAFSLTNCLAVVGVIPIILYLCSNQSASGTAFHLETYPDQMTIGQFVFWILRFDFVEWGIWALLLFRSYRKEPLYIIACGSLFLIPFFRAGGYENDFVMRASIPALIILMTYCIRYMLDCRKTKRILGCLIMTAIFVIGAFTPAVEFKRGFWEFVNNGFQPKISDEFKTVLSPLADNNNFIGNKDEAFFYRYVARK